MTWLLFLCLQENSDLQRLTERIEKNPQDARAYLERARAYSGRREPEKALADVDQAIALQPDLADAHVLRGTVLMSLKRKDDAYASWDRALRLNPNLRGMIEDLKAGRQPKRRGPEEDAEAARIEEKLRDPNLPQEERERLTRVLAEMRSRHGRGPDRMMSPEDLERLLAELTPWLRENDPETLRRIDQLRAEKRMEELHATLREAMARRAELEDLKQRDPEGYAQSLKIRDLERSCAELSEKIRRGDHGSEELRKQLAAKLGELFDLREAMRARELAELKRRVEELEKLLQKRKEGRQRIVEKRLRELLGERDPEDW